MKLYSKITFLLIIISLLFVYCGQGGSFNPVGVTGGGSNGYGAQSATPGADQDPSHHQDPPNSNGSLVGSWISSDDTYEYLLTINSDGSYKFVYTDYYETDEQTGYYSVSGNQIYIDGHLAGTYIISGNTLTLTSEGNIIVYTRI